MQQSLNIIADLLTNLIVRVQTNTNAVQLNNETLEQVVILLNKVVENQRSNSHDNQT